MDLPSLNTRKGIALLAITLLIFACVLSVNGVRKVNNKFFDNGVHDIHIRHGDDRKEC